MKRLFLFLVLASLIADLYATPSNKYQLVIRTTNGDSAFMLSQQPEISFTEKDIVVSNTETSITIPKTEFIEFLFTPNQYEVTFLNWDGEVLQSTTIDYGTMPEYLGVIPTKLEDNYYIYTFSGWEPEIAIVVANAEYTAQYDATDKIATAIENTQSNEGKTYKLFRNGQLLILRDGKTYNAMGQEIR